MKKILLLVAMAFCMAVGASARDTYSRDASVLPEAAQVTISNNFKARVSIVKIEKNLGRISEYEVILDDGSEISFDSKGNWENIEVGQGRSVPEGFVPAAVREYVKKNHKGNKIVGIERERSGYEVELSGGIDMKFDNGGRFLRYDD